MNTEYDLTIPRGRCKALGDSRQLQWKIYQTGNDFVDFSFETNNTDNLSVAGYLLTNNSRIGWRVKPESVPMSGLKRLDGTFIPRGATFMPEIGAKYYLISHRVHGTHNCHIWENKDYEIQWLNQGLVYTNLYDVAEAWDAMVRLLKGDTQ